MEDFVQKSDRMLARLECAMRKDFETQRDREFGGEVYPLYARFFDDGINVTRLLPGMRRLAIMLEHCYVARCEALDADKLQQYCDTLDEMVKTLVKPRKGHEFTFLSMIVLTDHMPLLLRTKLRRYKNEVKYDPRKQEYGHSSARLCIIDVNSGKMYTNYMGKPLADRTQKYLDEEKQTSPLEYDRADFGM